MSSPPTAAFLDFFVLEAGEYVEQIDGLLSRASEKGPDAEALQKIARALRGSATMAKLGTFADLASAFETIGRAMRQGTLTWNEALKGALTAAVDDLKILVRSARAWSPAEDQWAMKRITELAQFAPVPPTVAAPPSAASPAYFSGEMSNIAAGLELLTTRPDDREGAMNVLRRVRALRGVAGMRDIPALAEVSEAAESAVRPLEQGEARLTPERVNLLRVAADLLRTISAATATGDHVTASTAQYTSFLSALDAMLAETSGSDRVIPVADLFFHDAGPHILSAAPNPPTTPAQRFRIEVVSLGEHLHRVIDEARAAQDEIQREHAKGELNRALRAIRATAASFGQMAVAQTVEAYLERTGQLNVSALDAIASFATTISPAAVAPTPSLLRAVRNVGAATPEASAPPAHAPHWRQMATPRTTQPRPVASPESAFSEPASVSAPGGRVEGGHSLDSAIAAFESLATQRMADPMPIPDADLVPVGTLLYRGRAALDRAIELRDAIRRAGSPPPVELLEELYDLVDLARVD
jgi:chemotaxis protein histidine kinase CheA